MQAKLLVREDVRGYAIFHDSIREELTTKLKDSPQRHLYFAERITRRLAHLGNYVSAYFVAAGAGSDLADKISASAIRSASVQGDFKSARKILRDLLEHSR